MDWLTGSKQTEVKRLISQLVDAAKRDQAVHDLIRLGPDSVGPLIDTLQTQDPNLLLICQQTLARIPSAVPALVNALTTAHPLIRGRVLEVIGMSRDNSTIPALIGALKSEYFTVRSRAATVLAGLGGAQVLPELLPLLKDREDEVRIAACTAIGMFNDPSTFDEIANVLLDDTKIEVRQAAARALGKTKHIAAIPFLMEALNDSFWWYEREQAASDLLGAIENMGPAVVESLLEALTSKEGTVRKFAAFTLGELRDPRAIEELGMAIYDLHHEVSREAAEALVKFGSNAIDILMQALQHAEAGIRENAVLALGQIQDARVAPALLEMIRDPERSVRKQVVQSLGVLRDNRALPALQEISNDRTDREMAGLAKQVIETMK